MFIFLYTIKTNFLNYNIETIKPFFTLLEKNIYFLFDDPEYKITHPLLNEKINTFSSYDKEKNDNDLLKNYFYETKNLLVKDLNYFFLCEFKQYDNLNVKLGNQDNIKKKLHKIIDKLNKNIDLKNYKILNKDLSTFIDKWENFFNDVSYFVSFFNKREETDNLLLYFYNSTGSTNDEFIMRLIYENICDQTKKENFYNELIKSDYNQIAEYMIGNIDINCNQYYSSIESYEKFIVSITNINYIIKNVLKNSFSLKLELKKMQKNIKLNAGELDSLLTNQKIYFFELNKNVENIFKLEKAFKNYSFFYEKIKNKIKNTKLALTKYNFPVELLFHTFDNENEIELPFYINKLVKYLDKFKKNKKKFNKQKYINTRKNLIKEINLNSLYMFNDELAYENNLKTVNTFYKTIKDSVVKLDNSEIKSYILKIIKKYFNAYKEKYYTFLSSFSENKEEKPSNSVSDLILMFNQSSDKFKNDIELKNKNIFFIQFLREFYSFLEKIKDLNFSETEKNELEEINVEVSQLIKEFKNKKLLKLSTFV